MKYNSPAPAVQTEIESFYLILENYSLLHEMEIERLWKRANSECYINLAKRIDYFVYPTYEWKSDYTECVWNFRKEIISYSVPSPAEKDSYQFKSAWYNNKPTTIMVSFPDVGWRVERNFQWSRLNYRWSYILVKLKFENLENGRISTYVLNGASGGIQAKEETVTKDGKTLIDGWQFTFGYQNKNEVCQFYVLGELQVTDKPCQLSDQIPKNLNLTGISL